MTPSLLILASRILRSFDFTASGKLEALTSNLKWIAEETLLTFWPPGPLARIAPLLFQCSDAIVHSPRASFGARGRSKSSQIRQLINRSSKVT